MTAAAKPQADNNGAEIGAVVAPSITDMISSSVGTGSNGPTTLDDYDIRIDGLDSVPSGAAAAPATEQPRRGRGRPRKDGSTATAAIAAPKPGAARKKSELAAELERVQAELAAERARNDADKIAELAKLVEMSAYMGFGFAASKRGDHWALTKDEAAQIGSTGAVVLAPYAEQASKHMPWMTFAAVLGHAVWTRVQIDEQRVAQLNAANARAATTV